MALGRGWGGGDKHTRSTADQPALLPDYKVTWLWGGLGVHGKHTRSLLQTSLLCYRITK